MASWVTCNWRNQGDSPQLKVLWKSFKIFKLRGNIDLGRFSGEGHCYAVQGLAPWWGLEGAVSPCLRKFKYLIYRNISVCVVANAIGKPSFLKEKLLCIWKNCNTIISVPFLPKCILWGSLWGFFWKKVFILQAVYAYNCIISGPF